MGSGTQNDLDHEFRQILYIIKPLINNINDYTHLEKYRVWLERLNVTSPEERLERNKYLLELANQIHDNVLKPPFSFNPPPGPLPDFRSFESVLGGSQFCNPLTQKDNEPFIVPPRSRQTTAISRFKTREPKKINKCKVMHPFQKLGEIEMHSPSEASSWCDLSESDVSVNLACDDTDVETVYRNKEAEKHQHKHINKESPQRNRNELRTSTATANFVPGATEDKSTHHSTEKEVDALKMRMKDLLEVKNALTYTHCLTENRRKTTENLQMQLANTEKENAELKVQLEAQEKKLRELEKAKDKETKDFKDTFIRLREKEMEYVKQRHEDDTQSLKESYSLKMEHQLQQRTEELHKDYEEKIKKNNEANANLLQQKEEQIQKLETELKEERSNSSNQQVVVLKRCVSKLEKLLHKNEKEHKKKIEKLKQDLELKDATSQVQLQTQRVDLLVRNTNSKHEELNSALNDLEQKYKRIVESLQAQAFEVKKEDDKVIQDLKFLLEKNKIVY